VQDIIHDSVAHLISLLSVTMAGLSQQQPLHNNSTGEMIISLNASGFMATVLLWKDQVHHQHTARTAIRMFFRANMAILSILIVHTSVDCVQMGWGAHSVFYDHGNENTDNQAGSAATVPCQRQLS